ncbi:MAG TPA: right-handed parallel beta-helix repeat-containing protein, partial [Burkholderiales bacterium]|nr:right-handed parallel beta-helix repeat-containing protein [Burkholderiales bacterium]
MLDPIKSAYRLYPKELCGDLLPNPHFPNPYDTYKPANVAIQNLIIEKYANPPQTGAIGYFRPGLDWRIINNEVRYNHGSGIKFKGGALVLGNYAHHNGTFGIEYGDGNNEPQHGGHGVDVNGVQNKGLPEWGYWGGYAGINAVVARNTISHNNVILASWRGQDMRVNPPWGAGGAKFMQAENLLVLDNLVEQNNGPGLWTDFSYDGTVYRGNVVQKNSSPDGGAIFHEVSGSAAISCNTVRDNVFPAESPPLRQAQIFIS